MKTVRIYQLKEERIRDFGFVGYEMSKHINGREVERDDYDLIYSTELRLDGENILDDIYTTFNIYRPADFCGHSLSVSDVVEVDGEFWYCDSFGWKKLNW